MKAKKKRPVVKKTVRKAVKKAAGKPVKKPVRKPVKKVVKKAVKKAAAAGKKIGTITHYFPKVRAAVIKLKSPLAVGETIRIKGHTTDFSQTISSMQIDHVAITKAKKGDIIGLLVESRVRRHDGVSKA